jgi:5'-phosphate synthase pdxT subunit
MGKLLRELELLEPLRAKIEAGLPVLGTCAGMILLAENVSGGSQCFGTMDITVRRNAYGRQLGSFHTDGDFTGVGEIPMTFIRAPYIERAGEKAEILAAVDGNIVAARQGRQLAVSFHPELDGDTRLHEYFLAM